jgi:hypothetical protein
MRPLEAVLGVPGGLERTVIGGTGVYRNVRSEAISVLGPFTEPMRRPLG